ncbi:hypothetical protein JZO81_10550 [Enterococcus hulanensis]|uniref:hypothetical protein n=1 Tax=Enterococcus TaxID=1350 RepID=UPI000B5A2D99|nr:MULTISPECIES: hypothetical protein [Enterococcus]MBO0411502.1 hypothetical protein [Enterococcus hulanensis]OTO14253.1 hypothetical protein A5875_003410 [Enterococcus sp. 3H8_DIV0648]
MVKVNKNKILKTSIQERKQQTAALITLSRVKKNEHKYRDPKKAAMLKSFEEKRNGFKIGDI